MTVMTKRVNMSLPDPIYEDLRRWAEHRDQPVAAVAAIAVERAIRDAKAAGEFPDDPALTPIEAVESALETLLKKLETPKADPVLEQMRKLLAELDTEGSKL